MLLLLAENTSRLLHSLAGSILAYRLAFLLQRQCLQWFIMTEQSIADYLSLAFLHPYVHLHDHQIPTDKVSLGKQERTKLTGKGRQIGGAS